MQQQKRFLILALLALFTIGIGLWAGLHSGLKPASDGYADLGGDFTLLSDQGPVSLEDFRGKVVAIYFGFTHCPDVCITALSKIAAGLKQLSDAEREQVQTLFISIDPERDDPERVGEYVRYFDPSFIGLSGSLEQVTEVAKSHFVMFEKVPLEDSKMDYTMDHSSSAYIVGKDGVIRSFIHHGETPENIAQVLREALAG